MRTLAQFMRRCDKVAILDHGTLQYFGPFTPDAQNILARFLPIPKVRTDTASTSKHAALPELKRAAPKALQAPPATSMPMAQAAWELVKAGPGWKLLVALLLGLLAHSVRQMSDFWVKFWASDHYKYVPENNVAKSMSPDSSSGVLSAGSEISSNIDLISCDVCC
jgi:hypothetical protein